MHDLETIRAQSRQAAQELLASAGLAPGSLLVVGCSSSEITGGAIGKASSPETARAVLEGVYPLLQEREIWLAAQCCEHLNRALILEAACAERYGYDPVSVRPQPKAPGKRSNIRWPWSTYGPTRGWILAGPLSGCTCGMWRCRCGSAWTISGTPYCCAPGPGPSSSAAAGPATRERSGEEAGGGHPGPRRRGENHPVRGHPV